MVVFATSDYFLPVTPFLFVNMHKSLLLLNLSSAWRPSPSPTQFSVLPFATRASHSVFKCFVSCFTVTIEQSVPGCLVEPDSCDLFRSINMTIQWGGSVNHSLKYSPSGTVFPYPNSSQSPSLVLLSSSPINIISQDSFVKLLWFSLGEFIYSIVTDSHI